MANDKPILIVSTSIDEAKSKKELQKQLDSVSKSLKMDTGEKQREKALQYEHKTRLALAKTIESSNKKIASDRDKYERDFQKLLKQEESQMIKIHSQALKINSELGSNREKVLKEEQKTRLAITKITEKEITSEKLKTAEISKQTEKLKLYQAEFERKSSKLMAGQYGGRVDTGALDSLKSQVSGISIDPNNIKASTLQMQQMDSQFKNISTNAQLASRGIKGFGEDLSKNLTKFGEWMVASSVFYGVARSLQSGIQSVFELDKALTELKKVTTATNEEINQFTKDSYDMADALASTNIQVIEAVTVFSKMGYALDQSKQLGALAVKLQTVGDGMGSMEDTANSLVAVLKGFGVDENSAIAEVTKRVDQLNAVSNEMAVSTGDLTAGLQRASAGLAISGNTFEQSTALLTAGTEVLRDSEMVARGLITTSQRAYDQGADALRQYGIETTNANGSIRSTFDILSDVHSLLPTVTEDQQRWILTQIAGKDQFKTIASIMQNWNAVAKTMQVQMNANGSATDELNRKLDSLEGRLNKATNSISKFWNATINSGLVKVSISLFTEFADVLSTLTTATGGLILPTTLLALALMKFKDVAIVQMLLQTASAMIGLTVVEGTATIATVGLTTSVATLQLALGAIGLLLGAVAFAYNKHTEAVAKAEEETVKFNTAQEELTKTLAKGDSATKETVNELDKLSKKYDELISKQKELQAEQDERDKKSGVKQHERYKRESDALKEVNKEISDVNSKFKTMGTTYEEAGKKIKLGNEALKETAKQSKAVTQTMDNLSKSITDSSDNYSLLNDSQNELNKNGFITQSTIDAINEKYGKFIDVTKLSKEAMTEFFNVEKNGIRDRIKNNIADTQSELEKRKKTIEGIKAEILALGALAKVKGQSGTVAMYEQYAKGRQLEGVLKEMSGFEDKIAVMQNSLKIFDTIDKDKGEVKKTTSTPAEESYAVVEKDRYLKLNQAVKELNISLEQNKALQENTTDLSSLNKLREDEIALYKKKQLAIANLAVEQRKERDELIKSLNAKGGIFQGKGDDASFSNYQSIRDKLIDKMNKERLAKDKTNFNKTKEQLDQLDKQFTRFAELQTDNIPQARLEWTKLQTSINSVGQEITDSLAKKAEEADKEFKKLIQGNIDLLEKDLKKALKSAEDAIESENKSALKSLEDRLDGEEKALKKSLEAQETALENSLNAQEKYLENLAKTSEDSYNNRIDAIKNEMEQQDLQNEITQDQISLQEKLKKLSDLKAERANIESQKNVRFLGASGWEFIADPQALKENAEQISDAEKDLLEFEGNIKVKEAKRIKDAQIKVLEQQRDEEKKVHDKRLDDFKTTSKAQLDAFKVNADLQMEKFKTNATAEIEAQKLANETKLANFKLYSDLALQSASENNAKLTTDLNNAYATMTAKDKEYWAEKLRIVTETMNAIRAQQAMIGMSGGGGGSSSWSAPSGGYTGSSNTSGSGGGYSGVNSPTFHDGIEKGLVGGLPIPKNWEQVALLAKGEGVFNVPQMNNIANFVNSAVPRVSEVAKSSGNIIIQHMQVNANNAKDFAKSLQEARLLNIKV